MSRAPDLPFRSSLRSSLKGKSVPPVNLSLTIATCYCNLRLKIFENINIIECDCRDGLVNYVYNENAIEIDESRFDEVKL